MKTSFWLRVNSRGGVHTSQGQPRSVGTDEIAMKMTLELPNALFTKPRLEAFMIVPDSVVTKDLITPQITDNVAAAIKPSTGLDMVVRIVNPEDEQPRVQE